MKYGRSHGMSRWIEGALEGACEGYLRLPGRLGYTTCQCDTRSTKTPIYRTQEQKIDRTMMMMMMMPAKWEV